MVSLEVKFESRLYKKYLDCGMLDFATIRETLGRQLEELNEA